ncbi:hypothetical protein A4U88_1579 [Serratia marcescens]|nr:hypothetical protein A4U88_1579 [Serratia marcescens]
MSAFCTGQAHNLCGVKKLSAAKKPGAKGYPRQRTATDY